MTALKTSILALLIDRQKSSQNELNRVKYEVKYQLFVDVIQIHHYNNKYGQITTIKYDTPHDHRHSHSGRLGSQENFSANNHN